jgi:hypothetical protein
LTNDLNPMPDMLGIPAGIPLGIPGGMPGMFILL